MDVCVGGCGVCGNCERRGVVLFEVGRAKDEYHIESALEQSEVRQAQFEGKVEMYDLDGM